MQKSKSVLQLLRKLVSLRIGENFVQHFPLTLIGRSRRVSLHGVSALNSILKKPYFPFEFRQGTHDLSKAAAISESTAASCCLV